MTPAELRSVEDTLRRAYAEALATVQRADIGPTTLPSFQPARPPRWGGRTSGRRHWLVPAAAAVAVVALVGALVVPKAVQTAEPLATVPRHMAYVVGAGEVMPVNIATDVALRPIKLGAPGGPAG